MDFLYILFFSATTPDVEPTHGTSVRDKCAILAPNVGPTSSISILDKFAIIYTDFTRIAASNTATDDVAN